MSVKQAQREIDAREFAEWIAFFRLEPYGAEINDMQFASIKMMIAAAASGKKQKLSDHLLVKPPSKRQSREYMMSQFEAFKNAHNAALEGTNG